MCDVQVPSQPKRSRPNRGRILELARPKSQKTIWITSQGPRVQWGTQETLWPVTRESMSANCTPRLVKLSEPKRNFQGGEKGNRAEFIFSCGRSSMIWKVAPGALQADATPRLAALANPKQAPETYVEDRDHFVFSCGRSSPIWQTSTPPDSAPTPRVQNLANAKCLHREYKPLRDVRTEIPRSALSARVSERIENLASAKNRPEGPFREPMWPVSGGARSAEPSNRCLELARPKPLVDGYLPARHVVWDVPRAAKRAVANQRISEISQPIVRATMDHVQFDPDAFLVKETALKCQCSKRVEELAEPIRR